jgi:Pentapeptide repeats (8 copies)
MANERHVTLLLSDVAQWNAWQATSRQTQPDLVGACLGGANLRAANLHDARLEGADLTGAMLASANLARADLAHADLSGAKLYEARLWRATLREARLRRADLTRVDLTNAAWRGADLTGATLRQASLIETSFVDAILDGCHVYGASIWNVELAGAIQTNLRITPPNEPEITVDHLEVAQFLYLLHNERIRQVIDTLTSKIVLILGRFTPERKRVLDVLRGALRHLEYVPVLFDFAGPDSRDTTETVALLARLARFVVADLTDSGSVPYELATIVPHARVPVQPILQEGTATFAMAPDLWRAQEMLPVVRYSFRGGIAGWSA